MAQAAYGNEIPNYFVPVTLRALTACLSRAILKNSLFWSLPSVLASEPQQGAAGSSCECCDGPVSWSVASEARPMTRSSVSFTKVICMASFSAAATAVIT